MDNFDGKVMLVTGGARGLGAAICEKLCAAGATVVPVDVRQDLLEEMAAQVESNGGKVDPIVLDICDEKKVQDSIQRILEKYGRLDALVNNAAIDITVPIEELEVAEWDRIMAVNLRGPFVLSRLVFPVMKERGGGSIVNITSTAAKRAWANASVYHASKWGLLGLSHALHVEGRPHNIKVTAIVAGGMRTPFLLDRFPDIDLNNLQDPANVAETVRFVLSMPAETVIPEVTVIPMRETSWP